MPEIVCLAIVLATLAVVSCSIAVAFVRASAERARAARERHLAALRDHLDQSAERAAMVDSAVRLARNTASGAGIKLGTACGVGPAVMSARAIRACQDEGIDVRHVRVAPAARVSF